MIGSGCWGVGASGGDLESTASARCEWLAFACAHSHAACRYAAAAFVTAPAAAAAELPLAMPVKAPVLVKAPAPQLYDWTGFYAGVHIGDAWGRSNWSEQPDGLNGSLNMFQRYDAFTGAGSWFGGAQVGYDYMLPNRVVIGGVADFSAPSWRSINEISIGGISTFNSPTLGQESLSETVLDMGTVRGRIGYAPGNWLFYGTGGFAWSYNQLTMTQLDNAGTTDSPFLWRFGWAAGAGVEMPLAPNWTAGLEYLYTSYGNSTVGYANAAQITQSNLSLQQLRLTLNYRPGSDQKPGNVAASWFAPSEDRINVHGQTTFVWQSYPAIRSPYEGPNSLPARGQGRETVDATLYAGIRLWQGAEVWLNPEVDQGHGLADTHGVAGYLSGESYKLGFSYPYARMQRMFLRQTINLGGEAGKVDADINQFANPQTANRLVVTVGKFGIVDLFDTNKYANNPKTDFLNWALINAGTFDYAGDAWGYTYGGAVEWYQDWWTLRGGVFDLSATPAGGDSPASFGLDFDLQPISAGWRNRGPLPALGPARQAQGHGLSQPRPRRSVPGRHQSRPDHRTARGHHRRAHLHQSSWREPQSRAAGVRDSRRVCSRRLGRRHHRAVGLHGHR